MHARRILYLTVGVTTGVGKERLRCLFSGHFCAFYLKIIGAFRLVSSHNQTNFAPDSEDTAVVMIDGTHYRDSPVFHSR